MLRTKLDIRCFKSPHYPYLSRCVSYQNEPAAYFTHLFFATSQVHFSKNNENDEIKEYQVILTTGEGKYPDEYEVFIKQRFNKIKGDFILTKTKDKADNKK